MQHLCMRHDVILSEEITRHISDVSVPMVTQGVHITVAK